MNLEGFNLTINDGPKGQARDDSWPCVSYDLALTYHGRELWQGSYSLGVGHVKVKESSPGFLSMTTDEESLFWTWQSKPNAQFKDKELWANVAAKLARQQKVKPKLDDVLYSLLSDGAAFFDAQSHAEWCSDLGYDQDSIKAKAIYDQCIETGRKLIAGLGAEKVAELREQFADY